MDYERPQMLVILQFCLEVWMVERNILLFLAFFFIDKLKNKIIYVYLLIVLCIFLCFRIFYTFNIIIVKNKKRIKSEEWSWINRRNYWTAQLSGADSILI